MGSKAGHPRLMEADSLSPEDPFQKNRRKFAGDASGRHLVHLGDELVERVLINQDDLGI
jgi:hypothetical protein